MLPRHPVYLVTPNIYPRIPAQTRRPNVPSVYRLLHEIPFVGWPIQMVLLSHNTTCNAFHCPARPRKKEVITRTNSSASVTYGLLAKGPGNRPGASQH
jgi:hypothetical protein